MSQVQAVRLNMIHENEEKSAASSSQDSSVKGLWKRCLSLIEEELPPQTIQTWFAPITPVSFNKETLILRLPSRFLLEWVEPNYGELLRTSIFRVFGENTIVEFLIASSSNETIEPFWDEDEQKAAVSLTGLDKRVLKPQSDTDHHFTFGNFFCLSENEFSRKAALHVAQNLGKAKYNPLVIYGGIGSGKTHLLHALGNHIKDNHPNKRLVLMTSEQFVHEYVFALQNNQINKFMKSMMSVDVFLLDDIQTMFNKVKSQDSVLFVISELVKKRIQVVITSNVAPNQLDKFNPRLISFLQTGLIVDLPSPEYFTREKIIRDYFEKNDIHMSDKVILFLAEALDANAHHLKSVLTRIVAQVSLTGKNLSLHEIRNIISYICPQDGLDGGGLGAPKEINIDCIVNATSSFYGVPVDILTGVSRKKKVMKTRQIAIYLCRELTGDSLSSIGYHFSNLHHASVLYAYNKVGQELLRNAKLKSEIQKIKALL